MRKYTKILLFFLLALPIMSCKKELHGLNEEFTLDFNKTTIVKSDGDRIEIKFTDLVEESRCPPGAQCVWQGQVAVKLRLDKKTDLVLGHHTTIPASGEYKSRSITLLGVYYDKDNNYGKEKHYSVKLRVD